MVIEAPALGWSSPVVLTMASLGVIGLAVFLAWERRAASPMLPLSIFAQRQFAAVNAVSFIVYAALTGATFLLPVVLQVVSGYSPLGSGLALTIIMLVLSGRSGELAAVTITNPAREHRDAAIPEPCLHCGLDAPPLAASTDRILAIQPRG